MTYYLQLKLIPRLCRHYALFVVLLMSIQALSGQAVFRHYNTIQGLAVDESGRLLVGDSEVQTLRLIDKNLRQTHKSKPIQTVPSRYTIWKGQLREELEDGFHLYTASSSIYDVATYGDQHLIAGEAGLLLFEKGQFRAFHISGISFPRALIKLSIGGDKLAMLDRAGTLYVFDLKEQNLKSVATDVNHFVWDKWNTLWYAQGRALGYDINYVNEELPLLEITEIKDGNGAALSSPISLEPGDELVIDYTSTYPPLLDEPELVYRLQSEEDWKKVTTKAPLKLRDLPAGTYEIQLRAEGLGGVSAFTKSLDVRVASDWLSRLWPTVAGVLTALLTLALISFYRLRGQMNKLKEEKEKTQLKVELQDKQQKIGQLQMNPHFLFNTLNSISGLIALNENKKARKYLNQFSQMMRKMLDGTRKDFLTLKNEQSFLEQYLSLEAMSRNNAFDFEVLIDEDLDEQSHIPAMILQPLVENAIIHCIAHKKEKGKVTVQFQKEGKYIKATVEDDGIGRDAAQAYRSETHNSAAMDIIKERLAALDKWNKTGIVYTDLKNENGEAAGTRVEVVLSVR